MNILKTGISSLFRFRGRAQAHGRICRILAPLLIRPHIRFENTSSGSANQFSDRNTWKHIFSRKTFLVDYYKYLNDNNEIVLYVHHNNMVKTENRRLRSELKRVGAQLNIVRNSIYNVYLKSAHEEDPADEATSARNKDNVHPLSPLLNGPTGIITISRCEPQTVAQVLKILSGAQEKLILIGARIESNVFDVSKVNQFKDLPNKEQLQSQLAGLLTLLGGAGLVRTLQASSNVLYLTMEERRKDMSGENDDKNSENVNE